MGVFVFKVAQVVPEHTSSADLNPEVEALVSGSVSCQQLLLCPTEGPGELLVSLMLGHTVMVASGTSHPRDWQWGDAGTNSSSAAQHRLISYVGNDPTY